MVGELIESFIGFFLNSEVLDSHCDLDEYVILGLIEIQMWVNEMIKFTIQFIVHNKNIVVGGLFEYKSTDWLLLSYLGITLHIQLLDSQ